MIDIIIPAYNAHPWIKDALDSIAKQTIKDQLVVTIVDDGSKTNYNAIKNLYQNKLNIQIIQLKRNHGAGYAKQKGLKKTSNPYICFMDADDILTIPTALELLLAKMDSKTNIVMGKENMNKKKIYHEGHMVAKLFKREFINKYKLRIPNYPLEEDIAFTTSAYALADNNIKKIKEEIYYYRKINDESITTKTYKNYDYRWLFKSLDYAYQKAQKYHKLQYFKKRFPVIWESLADTYYTSIIKKDLDLQERYLNNCFRFYQKYKRYLMMMEKTGWTLYTKRFTELIITTK